MKKLIVFGLIVISLLLGWLYFYTNSTNTKNVTKEEKKAKYQVILVDIMTERVDFIRQDSIKTGTIINLEEFGGNNIKVLEINDEGIKISREALRYEILSQNSGYDGEVREYTEIVVETVAYNTPISLNIDSKHPFGPEYTQPRFQYNIQFVK